MCQKQEVENFRENYTFNYTEESKRKLTYLTGICVLIYTFAFFSLITERIWVMYLTFWFKKIKVKKNCSQKFLLEWKQINISLLFHIILLQFCLDLQLPKSWIYVINGLHIISYLQLWLIGWTNTDWVKNMYAVLTITDLIRLGVRSVG